MEILLANKWLPLLAFLAFVLLVIVFALAADVIKIACTSWSIEAIEESRRREKQKARDRQRSSVYAWMHDDEISIMERQSRCLNGIKQLEEINRRETESETQEDNCFYDMKGRE